MHGLRRQLVNTGVRVGAVAPGTVLNELWGITDEEGIRRRTQAGEGLRSEDVDAMPGYQEHQTVSRLIWASAGSLASAPAISCLSIGA